MKEDVAMQARCIYCKREQYAIAVYDISYGKHPCVWCGKTPPKLTQKEYIIKLKEEVKDVHKEETK
jgi:hypothetical protein